jgi:hypothetical protein
MLLRGITTGAALAERNQPRGDHLGDKILSVVQKYITNVQRKHLATNATTELKCGIEAPVVSIPNYAGHG